MASPAQYAAHDRLCTRAPKLSIPDPVPRSSANGAQRDLLVIVGTYANQRDKLDKEGGEVKKLKARPSAKAGSRSNKARRKVFSIGRLRKYIDPGPPEEAERFVQLIYEERHHDRERVPAE